MIEVGSPIDLPFFVVFLQICKIAVPIGFGFFLLFIEIFVSVGGSSKWIQNFVSRMWESLFCRLSVQNGNLFWFSLCCCSHVCFQRLIFLRVEMVLLYLTDEL